MKRILALALCLASMFSISASAQYLVYDVKANITSPRLQVQQVKYSQDQYDGKAKAVFVLDTYVMASDTYKGYLLIPAGYSCTEIGSMSSVPFSTALLYLQRNSDKTKVVFAFDAEVAAAAFAKDVGIRGQEDELADGPTSLQKLKQAWITIQFQFQDPGLRLPYLGYGYRDVGFLGFGSGSGSVTCAGKAVVKLEQSPFPDACGTEPALTVNSGSGSVTALTSQVGELPIFDLCSFFRDQPQGSVTDSACAYGSWAIKFNKKMSVDVAKVSDPDTAISAKLGGNIIR